MNDTREVWQGVNEGSLFYLLLTRLIYRWNQSHMPLLSSQSWALSLFGWYSFSILLRVGCWVGLGDWLYTRMVYLQIVFSHSTNRAQWKVTSLMCSNVVIYRLRPNRHLRNRQTNGRTRGERRRAMCVMGLLWRPDHTRNRYLRRSTITVLAIDGLRQQITRVLCSSSSSSS